MSAVEDSVSTGEESEVLEPQVPAKRAKAKSTSKKLVEEVKPIVDLAPLSEDPEQQVNQKTENADGVASDSSKHESSTSAVEVEALPGTIDQALQEEVQVQGQPSPDATSTEVVDLAPQVETAVELVAEVAPTTPVPAEKKRGLFAWLGGLLKRKQIKVESQVSAVPTEAVAASTPGPLLDSDLALSPTALKKELAKQRRELRELNEARERMESEVALKTEQGVIYAEQTDQITAWANQVSRTFVWKVQEAMEKNLSEAKKDMAEHESAVKNLKGIEGGRVLKLRQTFHKSLGWALALCGGLICIASIIRFRNDIPRLDWLAFLYDPNISGPIIIVVLAVIVGVSILLSRRAKSEKSKWSVVIRAIVLSVTVGWVVWDSSQTSSVMNDRVNPFVDQHYFEIVTTAASIWVLWVLGSLITYYRGYSIFNREVDTQILSLQGVIESYVKTQQEISRLSLLYKQANDWLEILANALYRPWKTHPDWGQSKEYTNHYETFPLALRVAQAREGAGAGMQELERIIGTRLLTQGWRNAAFEDLVAQVGIEMGLPPGKFIVDLLDQDLPHQTNNSRALLKRFLSHSAETSQSGQIDLGSNSAPPQAGKTEPTDRYLVEVARKRLLDLIEKTQSVAISAARPRVEQIIDDPLITLRADSSGVDQFDPTESWDDFLTDSLGADSVDKSPLGVLTFTEEGRMQNLPSKVQSFVLVPKRLEKSLPSISSDSITVVPLGDDKPRSLEIIARIDVVGPADFNSVALLASAPGVAQAPERKPAKATAVDEEL